MVVPRAVGILWIEIPGFQAFGPDLLASCAAVWLEVQDAVNVITP
jgi:hypothetical protein